MYYINNNISVNIQNKQLNYSSNLQNKLFK